MSNGHRTFQNQFLSSHREAKKKRENKMFDTIIIEDTLEVKTADFFQKECIRDFRKKNHGYIYHCDACIDCAIFFKSGQAKTFS